MNRLLRKVTGMFLLLTAALSGQAVAQEPDSCTYIEAGGILTIEMESGNLSNTYWVRRAEFPGYSGSGYIEFIGGSATGVPGRSTIGYTFRISETGRYSFRVRTYRTEGNDDNVWVRFPQGGVITEINGDSTGTMGNAWFKYLSPAQNMWYMMGKTQYLGTAWGQTTHDVYVDFNTPGVYTVEFSGRSTGIKLDKFALFKTSGYYGMNPDNPQSATENCIPVTTNSIYVANPFPDTTFDADVPFTFTLPANTFADPQGGGIGYAALQKGYTPLPSWLTFNSTTRTFSGTPTFSDGGYYLIIVKGQDSQANFALTSFLITISGNNPPVVAHELHDTTIVVNEPFSFTFPANTFYDPDGQTLTYMATNQKKNQLPGWLTYDVYTHTLSGTPRAIGTDTVIVWANDGSGGMTGSEFVIFIGTNHLPVVSNPLSAQTLTTGIAFNYTIPANTFTDADGDVLTYSAALQNGDPLPAWLTFNSANGSFSGTPATANEGTYNVQISANDGNGGIAYTTLPVIVTRPGIQGILDNAVSRGNRLTIYPNPAENMVMVNLNGNQVSTLAVMDNIGNVIFERSVSAYSTELALDLSSLKPGIYFVKASSDKVNTTSMFIKK